MYWPKILLGYLQLSANLRVFVRLPMAPSGLFWGNLLPTSQNSQQHPVGSLAS